jgi:peroxiredoxin
MEVVMSCLTPGTVAPAFKLKSTPDQFVSLSDFKGRRVILAFYPADWSPVCSDELSLYNELLSEFKKYNAELIGISCDGVWCHVAFKEHHKLHMPLLTDFQPKAKITKAYGVYNKKEGISERALFVIDEKGIIHWSYVSPEGVNPGADGLLAALESLPKQQ